MREGALEWSGGGFIAVGALVAAMALPACSGGAGRDGTAQVLSDRITEHVAPYLADGNFSGSIQVGRRGVVVASLGFGDASADNGAPNTPDTRFHIASLSKPLTALALMLLVDEGRVSPQDPIARFLSGFPNGDRITVHHLLTHTSGIPDINRFPEYRDLSITPQTAATLTDVIAAHASDARPGDYAYSNSNYNLIARILEIVSGLPYGEFMAERIFRPLGMDATAHSGSRRDSRLPRPAAGQIPSDLRDVSPAPYLDWSVKTGNGSIVSTVGDLAAFLHRLYDDPIVSVESRDLMLRPHVDGNKGYGWFVGERNGRRALYYNGNTPGVSSAFELYPAEGLAVVVLANHDVALASGIARSVAGLAFGEPVEAPRLLPRYEPTGGLPGQEYVGRYPFGVGFDIAWEEGVVVARGAWPRYPLALVPIGEDLFYHRFYLSELRFERGPDGDVSGLTWNGRTVERHVP